MFLDIFAYFLKQLVMLERFVREGEITCIFFCLTLFLYVLKERGAKVRNTVVSYFKNE